MTKSKPKLQIQTQIQALYTSPNPNLSQDLLHPCTEPLKKIDDKIEHVAFFDHQLAGEALIECKPCVTSNNHE